MTNDTRTAVKKLLLVLCVVAGVALTGAAVLLGLRMTTCRYPGGGVSTTKQRVKAARDAVTQFMIETPRCPRDIETLVAGHFLNPESAKDTWGTPLAMKCPGLNDADGADVSSAGPDRLFGTADDICSWE
jgi:Type II secretion system (T2SS), protein G